MVELTFFVSRHVGPIVVIACDMIQPINESAATPWLTSVRHYSAYATLARNYLITYKFKD